MAESNTDCPKCGGEMIDGFVMDSSHGAALVSQWVKGKPRAKTLFGRIVSKYIIKTPSPNDVLPIATFRCQLCGFLESYARDEFIAT